MGTDISGIARNVLQERVNMKVNTSGEETEQDMTVSFMELMNQNSLPTGVDVSKKADEMEIAVNTENSTKTAYDTCAKPVKSVTVKEEVTPEKMQEEVSEVLDDYEESVRKILKEELGVTDEEISAAMESLGMNFLDFRKVQNLATLIQTLTGGDVGNLFLSDAFQNVMEQVNVLTEELCTELGITKEELSALCEAWEQMDALETEESGITDEQIVQATEDMADTEKAAESNVVKEPEMSQTSEMPETTEATKVPEATADKPIEQEEATVVKPEEKQPVVTEEMNESDETSTSEEMSEANKTDKSITKEENLEQDSANTQEEFGSGTKEQSFAEHSQNAKADTANSNVTVSVQQAVKTDNFAIPQESVQTYTNQVDAVDLIQQIARNVRVTISATTTSMEMQLNPENLGKIHLNISEREGVIRAQIATQTETVREALETQLVELRHTLNQQGVKVDAIEVTVATHEFEQNLEGNAKQEEQARRQMQESQKQARRNLNLNDLDGLTGMMTEEEQLAAQIMRDNGNQVDLTA